MKAMIDFCKCIIYYSYEILNAIFTGFSNMKVNHRCPDDVDKVLNCLALAQPLGGGSKIQKISLSPESLLRGAPLSYD